ncbi:MAG: ABC transporter ATP-binding protein [Anaerolineae bacterium]
MNSSTLIADIVMNTQALSVGYARRVVAKDLGLSLHAGELVCLIGPNGAGKSTLLRTLAGMQSPLSGHVLLQGNEINKLEPHERAKRLSVVLTERVDAGSLSAYRLVSLGRYPYTDWTGKLSPRDDEVIRWALASVGAADFAERDIHELSDGERQKVLVARALAQEPSVMLLDEPTAYLDLPRRVELMRTLRDLAHETQRAILLSTHDLDLALRSADRIWLMAAGGRLQVGAPEDLVLNGAFESAFHGEGVEFDKQTGSFRISKTLITAVQIVGEGIPALWTARALERAGFAPTTAPAPIRVEVIARENSSCGWQVSLDQQTYTCDSLYTVVQILTKTLQSAVSCIQLRST